MAIPESIQRKGFRKWYEQELLAGHLHLVLLIFSALAIVGGMEAIFRHVGDQPVLMMASVAIAAVIGVWALRRYLFLLMRAEIIANQAVCKGCQAYGRWTVEGAAAADAAADAADDAPPCMTVCCRRCGARWQIEW